MSDTWERAQKVLIDGTGTFSKKPQCFVEGSYPTHCIGGSGATIIGENGERYVDWMCGLGANLFDVNNVYTLPHVCEVEFAELIVEKFPCDKIKILKTGSMACLSAIRYARAYTGKMTMYGHGYHGHGNIFVAQEKPGLGCVKEGYIKYESLDTMFHMIHAGVAAVIVEPCVNDLSVVSIIQKIREKCREFDVLFIADEIVSGGRTLDYCFSNHWDLDPDIICLGKGLGNGHPLGIVGIRDRCLKDGCFVSTTFSGEIGAIRQGINGLKWLTKKRIRELWNDGSHLLNSFNSLTEAMGIDLKLQGYPTRATWEGDLHTKALFWERMLQRGHFCGAAWFISFNHTSTMIKNFLMDAELVLTEIKEGSVQLQGKEPTPVFKRT